MFDPSMFNGVPRALLECKPSTAGFQVSLTALLTTVVGISSHVDRACVPPHRGDGVKKVALGIQLFHSESEEVEQYRLVTHKEIERKS